MQKLKIYNLVARYVAFLTTLVLITSQLLYQPRGTAYAAVPRTINYQARITDNSGNPITTATTIQFSIYNSSTAGSPTDSSSASGPLLWTETYDQGSGACQQITPNADGMISVQLGSCEPFPSYLKFDQQYYLGIKIASNNEAAPRVAIAASAYAQNVQNVTFDENNPTAFTIGTANQGFLSFDSTTGSELINVLTDLSIGTATTYLDVNSIIRGTNAFKFEGNTVDGFQTNFVITDPTADQDIIFPDNSGTVVLDSTIASIADTYVNLVDLADVVLTGSSAGDVIYWNGSSWVNLPAGSNGQFLQSDGSGGLSWVNQTFIWDEVPYDGTNSTVYGGTTLKPHNQSSISGIVLENSSNLINTIRIVNRNDSDNYAGSALVLKGSGSDYRNQLYFGIFGNNFYQTPFQNTALLKARDKDLFIGTHSDTAQNIRFFSDVDDTTYQPDWIATFNGTGVYFNSLQTLSSAPANSGVIMSDLTTGQLVAVDPGTFTNIYTADGTLTGERVLNGNSSLFGMTFTELSEFNVGDTGSINLEASGDANFTAPGFNIGSSNTLTFDITNGGSAVFNDHRTTKIGVEYGDDYSANFTARSLVDKAYVDSHVGTSIFDADSDTGIQVEASPDEDYVRMQTAGAERFVIDNNGNTGIGIGSNSLVSILQVGPGTAESSTFAVAADPSYMNIATFRDQDGENVFRSQGSLSNDDLLVTFGDWDWAYDHLSFGINAVTDALEFYGGDFRLHELGGSNLDYVGFKAPNDVTSSVVWTLPTADGSANYLLQTDGAGNLSWADPSTINAVNIYNSNGVLAGDREIETTGHALYFFGNAPGVEFSERAIHLNYYGWNTTYHASRLTLNDSQAFFQFDPAGPGVKSLDFNESQMLVRDNYAFKGMEYDADYSANFTDRSLVDKAYVDNAIGSNDHIFANNGGIVSNTGNDSNVSSDNFVFGSPTLDYTTESSRMFFNKAKGAFRAGNEGGTNWDDANVGQYSIGLGRSGLASGFASVTIGQFGQATAFGATALGNSSMASGTRAIAINGGRAFGDDSVAIGGTSYARSYREIAIGPYAEDYTPNSATSWDDNDRLLVVGGGYDSAHAKNAFVLYKSGLSYWGGVTNYISDFSASFTDRSLVDKAYVDNLIGSSSLWFDGTNGYYSNIEGIIVGDDVTETISNPGFVFAQGDLFVQDQLGVEGSIYTDSAVVVGSTTTLSDGSLTRSTSGDGNLTISTTGGTDGTLELNSVSNMFMIQDFSNGRTMWSDSSNPLSATVGLQMDPNNIGGLGLGYVTLGNYTGSTIGGGLREVTGIDAANANPMSSTPTRRAYVMAWENNGADDVGVDVNAINNSGTGSGFVRIQATDTINLQTWNSDIGIVSAGLLQFQDVNTSAIYLTQTGSALGDDLLNGNGEIFANNGTIGSTIGSGETSSSIIHALNALGTYVSNLSTGDSTTASNGLTMSGNDVQLGGLITAATYLRLDSNQSLYVNTNGYVGTNNDQLSVQFYGGDSSTSPAFNVGVNTNYGMQSYATFNMRNGLVSLSMDDGNKSLTMNSSGLTIRSNDNILLDAPSNSVQLANQPDGTNDLAVATVKYVNDNTGADSDWTISGSDMYSAVSGHVGIGTTSPGYQLTLVGDGSAPAKGSLELATYTDSGTPSGIYFHRARGTESAPTAVTSGSPMGGVMVGGYDGSSMVAYSGGFQMEATEDWSSGGHGTKLFFSTTENGTSGMTTKMTIDHNGNVGIGTPSPVVKLDVDGAGQFAGTLKIGAYTLPNTDGTSGQVLQTDGSGNVTWASVSGGGGTTSSIWDADSDTGVQVEESADEDAIRFDTLGVQRMLIGSNGLLSYGTETTDYNVAVFGTVHSRNVVKQETSDMAGYAVSTWGDNTSPSRLILNKARGSEGAETAVQSGDEIGEIGSIAHDGTRYISTGGMIIAVDGAVGTDNIPTKLKFLTNTGGGNLGSDVKMTLDHNGNLGIGTETPGYKLDVSGTARTTGALTIGDYTLPVTDGSSGQVLQTDGSGNVSWASVSGGTSYWSKSGTNLSPATSGDDVNLPTGSSLTIVDLDEAQLLFADSGGVVSSANGLYWDNNNHALGIGVMNPMMALEVAGGIEVSDAISFSSSGATISSPSVAIEVNTDIVPDTDNSHTLGSSSRRWTEVYAVNGTINTSDVRLKENIRKEPYGLKEVLSITPILFNWKDKSLGQKDKLGFSAQDLQKVIPEVVNEDPETGRLGVYYSDLIPVLWNAVKEQQNEIEQIANSQKFGHAKVEADKSSVWVDCTSVADDSVITVTPNKLVIVAVTRKEAGKGFEISVGEHEEDVVIDWIVSNK